MNEPPASAAVGYNDNDHRAGGEGGVRIVGAFKRSPNADPTGIDSGDYALVFSCFAFCSNAPTTN